MHLFSIYLCFMCQDITNIGLGLRVFFVLFFTNAGIVPEFLKMRELRIHVTFRCSKMGNFSPLMRIFLNKSSIIELRFGCVICAFIHKIMCIFAVSNVQINCAHYHSVMPLPYHEKSGNLINSKKQLRNAKKSMYWPQSP